MKVSLYVNLEKKDLYAFSYYEREFTSNLTVIYRVVPNVNLSTQFESVGSYFFLFALLTLSVFLFCICTSCTFYFLYRSRMLFNLGICSFLVFTVVATVPVTTAAATAAYIVVIGVVAKAAAVHNV